MDYVADISIGHCGINVIDLHQKKKSITVMWKQNKKLKITKIRDFLLNKNKVTRAECLFMAFLIELNLSLSRTDHIGSLLQKIFSSIKSPKIILVLARK